MSDSRSWRETGYPRGRVRLGRPGWRLGALSLGILVSVVVHGSLLFAAMSTPFDYLMARGGPRPHFPTHRHFWIVGVAALLGALAWLTVRLERRGHRDPVDATALASAVASALALALGFCFSWSIGHDLPESASRGSEWTFFLSQLGYVASLVLALVAVRRVWPLGRKRGTIFVLWGILTFPQGAIVFYGMQELVFVRPANELVSTLPPLSTYGAFFPDPRDRLPTFVVDATGVIRTQEGQVLVESSRGDFEPLDAHLPAPDDRAGVFLFVDAGTEFDRVEELVRFLAKRGRHRMLFGVRRPNPPWLGSLPTWLHPSLIEGPVLLPELRLHRDDAGAIVYELEGASLDLETLQEQIAEGEFDGPITTGPRVTWGDVARLFEVSAARGVRSQSWFGSHGR